MIGDAGSTRPGVHLYSDTGSGSRPHRRIDDPSQLAAALCAADDFVKNYNTLMDKVVRADDDR